MVKHYPHGRKYDETPPPTAATVPGGLSDVPVGHTEPGKSPPGKSGPAVVDETGIGSNTGAPVPAPHPDADLSN